MSIGQKDSSSKIALSYEHTMSKVHDKLDRVTSHRISRAAKMLERQLLLSPPLDERPAEIARERRPQMET